MLSVHNIELAVGARVLLSDSTFQVRPGDRIGLVGRNGAGKTTLCKVLAGEVLPNSGTIQRAGSVAYLPQDPRTGNLEVTARDRVLSARGLDALHRELQELAHTMGSDDEAARDKAMDRYSKVESRFESLGGWAAGSEAATIISSLGLADRVLDQPLGTLSGGQRRRVELARVLFSGSGTLLLDEPTNHLDADSIAWLRGYLRNHEGGFIVISHDTELLGAVVNRVFHLDAERSVLDVYNLGWKRYLDQRDQDDRRRVKERDGAERRAESMLAQANKMRARASGAKAAQTLDRRRAALLAGVEEVRRSDKVAKLRFPQPAPAGRTPLQATGLTRRYGSLEIFSAVDLAIDRGSRVVVLGLNGAGKTTLLRILAGVDEPDAGEVIPGHGLVLGYYAQEHETLDPDASVFLNLRRSAPAEVTDVELRRVLGAFLFSGDRTDQLAGTLSGGEKTRLALAGLVVSGANVLLLDEPTNNLDPASRREVLAALEQYAGAIVLVTHDPGAVDALSPDRVLLLPDGTEDQWNDAFADLVSLA
ncbi:MAG TPA: ABC-F family ATP-binding cassette domain-containing protein [Acidimicrobiales bacterium]|jgi:ATPase subunit of ABC transporter with duplicated ATPase domains|nr:ABC-F family ATP-binding cassette domain-containing protein [Acidimicrobiales bacterium]